MRRAPGTQTAATSKIEPAAAAPIAAAPVPGQAASVVTTDKAVDMPRAAPDAVPALGIDQATRPAPPLDTTAPKSAAAINTGSDAPKLDTSSAVSALAGVTLALEPAEPKRGPPVHPSSILAAQLTQDPAPAASPQVQSMPVAPPTAIAPPVGPQSSSLAGVAADPARTEIAPARTEATGHEPGITTGPTASSATIAPETPAARAQRAATHPAIAQVAVSVAKAAQDGVDRITIKLQPPELGRIDVRIDVGVDGRLQAVFAAERPATIEILQRDVRELERALQNAGLSADAGSLSFGLKQQGGGRPSPLADDRRRPGVVRETDPAEDTPMSRHAARRRADGHLDIHV